jgi:immunity protein, SdpI family
MSVSRGKAFPLDILTIAVLAGAIAITVAMYDRLPDPMPTHFDIEGRPNGWMTRCVGAWFVPVLSVGVVAVLRFGGLIMPSGWRERLAASPVRFISFAVAAALSGVHVLVLRASLSTRPRLDGGIWVLLGALFVSLGLVLPRTRRNPFFGVRTAFALASDENWARTQRVGGYSMTIGGMVALAAGLLGSPSVAIAAIIVSAIAPAVWSWMLARRGPGDTPPSISVNK